MKLKSLTLLIAGMAMLGAVTVTTFACKKDEKCDTANVSFKDDIAPLLKDKGCTASKCHSAGDTYPYITYTEVKAVVDAQRLVGAVKRSAGFSPMPKGGEKLDECSISLIEAWVTQGAKNN